MPFLEKYVDLVKSPYSFGIARGSVSPGRHDPRPIAVYWNIVWSLPRCSHGPRKVKVIKIHVWRTEFALLVWCTHANVLSIVHLVVPCSGKRVIDDHLCDCLDAVIALVAIQGCAPTVCGGVQWCIVRAENKDRRSTSVLVSYVQSDRFRDRHQIETNY